MFACIKLHWVIWRVKYGNESCVFTNSAVIWKWMPGDIALSSFKKLATVFYFFICEKLDGAIPPEY